MKDERKTKEKCIRIDNASSKKFTLNLMKKKKEREIGWMKDLWKMDYNWQYFIWEI